MKKESFTRYLIGHAVEKAKDCLLIAATIVFLFSILSIPLSFVGYLITIYLPYKDGSMLNTYIAYSGIGLSFVGLVGTLMAVPCIIITDAIKWFRVKRKCYEKLHGNGVDPNTEAELIRFENNEASQ